MHRKSREAITMDTAANGQGGGRMKSFFLGVLSALLLGALIGLLVVSTGIVSVSTRWELGAMEDLLSYASRRSIAHHANDVSNPFPDDKATLAVGLDHYKENCLCCHAAPGFASLEFAKGLSPPAPKLTTDSIQKLSDGELFWVVSNGIRMTGMPAFSPTHDEEEIWAVVAFVRHLGSLSDEEKAELGAGRQDEGAHHDHHHAEATHEAEPPSGAAHDHSHEEADAATVVKVDHHPHEPSEVPTPAQEEHKEESHVHEPTAEPVNEPLQEGGSHHEHSKGAPSTAPAKMAGPTDGEIIHEQKPSYPAAACVISSEELGKKGEPVDYIVTGRLIRLCCNDCKKDVDKDPAAVFKMIEAAVVAAQKPGYPLTYDPITGEILGNGAIDYIYGTRLVRLANEDSVAPFLRAPKTAQASLDKALIDAQRASYPLETCVVSGKTLGSMEGGPIDYLYGTRLVRFCCKDCIPQFEQNPARHLSKIDEAARTTRR